MKLPTKIKVGRTWYAVEVVEEYKKLCGACRPLEKRIIVAKRNGAMRYRYSKKEQAETFWHELVHAILHDMGERKLNANEKFVDAFALQLSNAIRSAKFGDEFDVEKWKRENL